MIKMTFNWSTSFTIPLYFSSFPHLFRLYGKWSVDATYHDDDDDDDDDDDADDDNDDNDHHRRILTLE